MKEQLKKNIKYASKKVACFVTTVGKKMYRKVRERGKEKLLYVIPKSMRKSTAVKFYDLMEHFSVDKTVYKIKQLCWFPYMKKVFK